MPGTVHSQRLQNLVITSVALLTLLAGMAYFGATHATTHRVIPSILGANPKYTLAGNIPDGPTFKCQLPTAAVQCYGPQQIRSAYDVQAVLDSGVTGKGRTIVIVDAYQSPTIQQDLQTFDQVFGLNNPTLNIIAPDGLTPFNPGDAVQVGWSGEITLDVEWSHAIAPDATIDLVLAKSSNDPDIYSATKYAVDHNLGDVISQSFGEGEICVDPTLLGKQHQLFYEATLKGITLIASAGDQGAAQPTCDGNSFFLSASSPAVDPFVLAVGGTQLHADLTTGTYQSETAWNEPNFGAAGGGGFSTIYHKPFYQFGTSGMKQYRGVPDVSYDAAINGGVLVVYTVDGQQHVYIFGGTSAGSPQWAGIVALGNQKAHRRLGFLNPTIYLLGHSGSYQQGFHDVTIGDNTYAATDVNNNPVMVNGYSASQGWDPVTGWGSPNVDKLLPLFSYQAFFSAHDVAQLK